MDTFLSLSQIFRWYKRSKRGTESIVVEPGLGEPIDALNEDVIAKTPENVLKNR
jgi:hypothetical protein